MNNKYRVDYFTDKHNKRFFDNFDLAYQFAFNMSIKPNVSAAFILELVNPDKCLYDVVIQV